MIGAGVSAARSLCYDCDMTDKSATSAKKRPHAVDELPVLSDSERAQLLASLEEARQRIKSGEGIDFDPKTFKQRLIDIYRAAKRERR
jgi:hypothetical protein